METNKFDLNLLSDEEAEGLKIDPATSDEPEPTPAEEEKVEKEPSPPSPPAAEPAPKPEVKVEPIPERFVVEPKPVITPDFKALAKKIYESEEEAPAALEEFFNFAREAARQEMGVSKEVAEKAVEETLVRRDFEAEVLKMKAANPWIEGKTERYLVMRAAEELTARKVSPMDLPGLLQVANDVLEEGKQLFKIQAPRVDAPGSKTKTSKFDELDKLSGLDLEEAMGRLSENEKEALLKRA